MRLEDLELSERGMVRDGIRLRVSVVFERQDGMRWGCGCGQMINPS